MAQMTIITGKRNDKKVVSALNEEFVDFKPNCSLYQRSLSENHAQLNDDFDDVLMDLVSSEDIGSHGIESSSLLSRSTSCREDKSKKKHARSKSYQQSRVNRSMSQNSASSELWKSSVLKRFKARFSLKSFRTSVRNLEIII